MMFTAKQCRCYTNPRNGISGYATVREDATVVDLAKKYGVTGAQIVLAWHVQRGVLPIVKSSNAQRQKDNIIVGISTFVIFRHYLTLSLASSCRN